MSLASEATRFAKLAQLIGYTHAAEIYGIPHNLAAVVFSYVYARKNKMGEYGVPNVDHLRVPQAFTSDDITEWKNSLAYNTSLINLCFDKLNFPMNHDSCYMYNSQCQYYMLCQQNRELEKVNTGAYVVSFWDVTNE
jgi:hypothetical protein